MFRNDELVKLFVEFAAHALVDEDDAAAHKALKRLS